MTAPEVMTVHLTDETLAAFVDDRLNREHRRAAMEHLAACDECRTFLNDVSDIKAMTEADNAMDEADNVVPITRRGGWRVAVASVAVAAGLLVVFSGSIREWVWGQSMAEVVAAAATMDYRSTEGRLSIELPHKEAKRVLRGSKETEMDDTAPYAVHDAVGKLLDAKSPDPHTVGIALLMAPEYGDPVPYLEKAAKTDEKAKIDLAAALLARGRKDDIARALVLSQQSNVPEALWNRAVALGQLHRDKEAIEAWQAYLRIDPSSDWANEAQGKITSLKEFGDFSPTADRAPTP
jgi:tetratricopeptide (TPR) repeat protein